MEFLAIVNYIASRTSSNWIGCKALTNFFLRILPDHRYMSTVAKLRGADFDSMVARGAFDSLEPMKIELIHGELRFMNPAGPIHEGEIEYLTNWSYANTDRNDISIRVQSGINCGEHRPEPNLAWICKLSSRRIRPTNDDVLLLVEVSDSSLKQDLGEKADLTLNTQCLQVVGCERFSQKRSWASCPTNAIGLVY